MRTCLLLCLLIVFSPIYADQAPPLEVVRTSKHTVEVAGEVLAYTATAGTLTLRDERDQPLASLFYVAYHATPAVEGQKRPITFCFNGGPGSASLWLHLGGIGPKRIRLNGTEVPAPPYEYVENPHTLLAFTDLIFIDPVSTGYSRPVAGVEAKKFHEVQEDVRSLAAFIELYITKQGLWDSPKFLLGESYGTFRATALASYLHEARSIYLNGVVLISTVLNFGTLWDPTRSNDLPYVLMLPSYTAAAHYHNKLSADLQKDLPAALKRSEAFAYDGYTKALMRGNALTDEEKLSVANTLSELTALPVAEILRARLRIPTNFFFRELLKGDDRFVGRWDARYTSKEARMGSEAILHGFDPSAEAVMGVFTTAFRSYLKKELTWEGDQNYITLADIDWNYVAYQNQFASSADKLTSVMIKNPHLHLFVASGLYDLATPYFATNYSLSHLGLDASSFLRINEQRYESGHMIYLHDLSLAKMRNDLAQFYQRATGTK